MVCLNFAKAEMQVLRLLNLDAKERLLDHRLSSPSIYKVWHDEVPIDQEDERSVYLLRFLSFFFFRCRRSSSIEGELERLRFRFFLSRLWDFFFRLRW
jgi:hypothetical protein